MKRIFKYITAAASAVLTLAGCSFNDMKLQESLDGIAERIKALQEKIDKYNTDAASLSELLSGNVATSITNSADGSCTVTYLDGQGNEKTLVLGGASQMLNSPILGVRKDDKGVYWWTITENGSTRDLTDEAGNPRRVAGKHAAPILSVNAEGYWTIDGEILLDTNGQKVEAAEGTGTMIKNVAADEQGNLLISLGNGQNITIPVQKEFNLLVNCEVCTTVVDLAADLEILYRTEGADNAIVDIADAVGMKASIDRQAGKVTLKFDEDFQSGRLVLFAYDFTNTVIRPLFFKKSAETRIRIASAAQWKEFASRVNAQDGAEQMEVYLDADLDFGGEELEPAGNGLASSSAVITGASFKGKFYGQGHTVDNFTISAASAKATPAEGSTLGLFGVLENATVSNLHIGSRAVLNSNSPALTHIGAIAGYCLNSEIENCTSKADISLTAVTNSKREVAGGIVGSIYSTEGNQTYIKACSFYGKITSGNTVNTNNGGNGISLGGIVGFADGKTHNLVENCTNNADITAQATRLAGIVATANSYTIIRNCTNNGAISNSDVTASNCRSAGICSAASTESSIIGCINKGNVSYTVEGDSSKGYVAGILGQANNPVLIEACENYGSILSDMFKGTTKYMGILVGNFNSKACTVTGCKVGGKIGPLTEDGECSTVTIDAGNFQNYITLATDKKGNTSFNANIYAGTGPKGIQTLADLMEFRDLVNSGASYEKFQSEDGSIKLLADIDMDSVQTWEPIGKAEGIDLSSNYAISCTGNPFSGVFDGNGHIIKNFHPQESLTSGAIFGLFGTISDAVVKNLTMGISGDSRGPGISSEGLAAAAIFCGVVLNSDIVDCTNWLPFTFNGSNTDNKRVASGIFAGFIDSTKDGGSSLSGLVNNADATVKSGSNTKNGATSVHFGGIAGFSSATQNSDFLNIIENCENKGDIQSSVGRSSGIVAAANSNTQLRYCVNRGNQTNDFSNSRIGNITCIVGPKGVLDDCTNYGNVTTSFSNATAGGLVALFNDASVVMTGGANYGTIICANDQYHGLLAANMSKFAKIDGVHIAGACGSYKADGQHQMHEITKDNWMSHIGSINASYTANVTNLTSAWGDAPTGTLPEMSDARLRILFIGNSFTKDAVEHLPGLLGAAGIDDVTLAHCYFGGRTIPQYNDGWKTTSDYTLYYKNAGASAWTTHNNKVSLQSVAESGRWDIITIQEHTGNYVAWTWSVSEKAAVQGLLDKCKASQSTKPKTYYILSQAYFNMNKIGTASKPYITWKDQAGMYEVIIAQGKKVQAETDVDGILSTCTYFQNLRTSSINNDMDLTRDGYHMDYGISRYGAACLMFESLITPVFGKNLDGNGYRYTDSSTSDTAYSTPTTDENIPIALQAARNAIAKPFEITSIK